MSGLGIPIEPNVDLIESGQTYNLLNDDKINRWGNVVSTFQDIPGLVGFWPMSSVQRSTGNAFDLSSQGRTLTYNGNPTYNIYQDFVPYIDLDGTGDFLRRADETDLDITGTETIYNSSVRGLTMGGWFWFDREGVNETLMGKFGAVGQFSYRLIHLLADNTIIITFSSDGTATHSAASLVPTLGQWHFVVGKLTPSIETAIFLDANVKVNNSVAVPASIFNSTASFDIGVRATGSQILDGRVSLCFLSANTLPDSLIRALFQQSRVLFGV